MVSYPEQLMTVIVYPSTIQLNLSAASPFWIPHTLSYSRLVTGPTSPPLPNDMTWLLYTTLFTGITTNRI